MKKGLKENRGKKGLVVWIVLFLIVLMIVVLFFKGGEHDNGGERVGDGNLIGCSSDADCVIVETSCCNCNMGGDDKCVLKSEEENYLNELSDCSDKLLCTAVFNCDVESCKCINGECVG
jgi:hypothetical protein